MTGINWYVFTEEEKQLIQKAIDKGDRDNVVCLIADVNMDQEKEAEIQKIVDQMTPDDESFVSEIEDEVSREFLDGIPEADKTPELEAKFQKKLDDERAEFVAKKKGRKKKEVAVEEEEKEDEKSIINKLTK